MRRLLKNTESMRFNAFLTHGLDFKRINPQNASKVPIPALKRSIWNSGLVSMNSIVHFVKSIKYSG